MTFLQNIAAECLRREGFNIFMSCLAISGSFFAAYAIPLPALRSFSIQVSAMYEPKFLPENRQSLRTTKSFNGSTAGTIRTQSWTDCNVFGTIELVGSPPFVAAVLSLGASTHTPSVFRSSEDSNGVLSEILHCECSIRTAPNQSLLGTVWNAN